MFQYRSEEEGKAGAGLLPPHLVDICRRINEKWSGLIPDLDALTYHTWYSDMSRDIKADVDELRSDPFFYALCDPSAHSQTGISKCHIFPIDDMNELYYSRVTQADLDGDLFGATSNFIPHRDMYFTIQPGIRVYRVLIGISEKNDTVSTVFDVYGAKKKLNRGDYITFDFSKTTHHVEVDQKTTHHVEVDQKTTHHVEVDQKTTHHVEVDQKSNDAQNKPNGRIMLKLHYVVSEPDQKFSDTYIHFIKWLHVQYEYITRYIMKTGTNPQTYYQFFVGLLSQSFMNPIAKYIALFVFLAFFVIGVAMTGTRKRSFMGGAQIIFKSAGMAFAGLLATYAVYVLWFYMDARLRGNNNAALANTSPKEGQVSKTVRSPVAK
jgi:hypothetical protein